MDPKKGIRAIVRQVHPDLFTAHPYEHGCNSESLKTLNAYADQLSQGQRPEPAWVEFYVRDATGGLSRVSAELPANGSLGPLFLAFGLITREELKRGAGVVRADTPDDRNLAAWLHEVVAEAVRAADAHDALKRLIRQLRAGLEAQYGLAGVAVGGEFAVSAAEQQRQVDALRTLEACLATLCAEEPQRFEGLSIRLYHPDSCPMDTLSFVENDGAFNASTAQLSSHVADDGVLHVVADRSHIQEAMGQLDLERARLLSRLTQFWARRTRDLSAALQHVLGVENVWCDTRTEDGGQRFVLWAGAVLEARAELEAELGGRTFSFSLLVHSDQASPMLDFLPSTSVLQVRSDCPPALLLNFLRSEAGEAAHASANQLAYSKQEEEELLEQVRAALGARHVIRVCSSYDVAKVTAAAHRLIENAPTIRTAVDLAGASIAIDDCYELWESGFISIPFDFNVSELQPRLQALLASSPPGTGAATNGVGSPGGSMNDTHAKDSMGADASNASPGSLAGSSNGTSAKDSIGADASHASPGSLAGSSNGTSVKDSTGVDASHASPGSLAGSSNGTNAKGSIGADASNASPGSLVGSSNGTGRLAAVRVQPTPVQRRLPMHRFGRHGAPQRAGGLRLRAHVAMHHAHTFTTVF